MLKSSLGSFYIVEESFTLSITALLTIEYKFSSSKAKCTFTGSQGEAEYEAINVGQSHALRDYVDYQVAYYD